LITSGGSHLCTWVSGDLTHPYAARYNYRSWRPFSVSAGGLRRPVVVAVCVSCRRTL